MGPGYDPRGGPEGGPVPALQRIIDDLKAQNSAENSRELALAIQRLEEGQHWLWQREAIRLSKQRTLDRP